MSVVVEQLTDSQWRTLAAAADRIMPPDGGVGAVEAGVIQYFRQRIARPELAEVERRLVHGATLLDLLADARYGRGFVECGDGEQDQLLGEVQGIPNPRTQRFFASLFNMTVAGFLGDPVHGGNRAGVGWRAIGHVPRRTQP